MRKTHRRRRRRKRHQKRVKKTRRRRRRRKTRFRPKRSIKRKKRHPTRKRRGGVRLRIKDAALLKMVDNHLVCVRRHSHDCPAGVLALLGIIDCPQSVALCNDFPWGIGSQEIVELFEILFDGADYKFQFLPSARMPVGGAQPDDPAGGGGGGGGSGGGGGGGSAARVFSAEDAAAERRRIFNIYVPRGRTVLVSMHRGDPDGNDVPSHISCLGRTDDGRCFVFDPQVPALKVHPKAQQYPNVYAVGCEAGGGR